LRYQWHRFRNAALHVIVLAIVLAIGVLSLLPGQIRPHPFGSWTQLEHTTAYMVAAAVAALFYAPKLKALHVFAYLSAYGVVLEVGQLFVPGRNAALIDVAADIMGISIGIGAAHLLAQKLPKLHATLLISARR
jgi:VanZ family protein